jgi:MFS family permease
MRSLDNIFSLLLLHCSGTCLNVTTSFSRSSRWTRGEKTTKQAQAAPIVLNKIVKDYHTMSSSSSSTTTTTPLAIDDAMELLGMGRFQLSILWAAGLCFMADAMEVLLLSFLAPILRSEWLLSERQMDTIISVVFAGALCGTLILSPLGDMVGRKPMFRVTAAMIALFGVLTAFCQTHGQLLAMRFLVGFGVGGLTVPFDTLSEFLPSQARGSNLLYIEFFWTVGTLSVPLLAYVSLKHRGDWPLFVILCSIPCILSTGMGIVMVPESPRWLLGQGRNQEALEIMKYAATKNGKNPDELFPQGTMLIDPFHHEHHHQHHLHETVPPKKDSGLLQRPTKVQSMKQWIIKNCCDGSSVQELFSPTWKRITLLLWGAWFGLGFLYYGVIIAVSIVFTTSAELESQQEDYDDYLRDSETPAEYDFDYTAIFISASAEIFGLLIVLNTIDRWGRIPSQATAYWAGGVACLGLGVAAYLGGPRFVLIGLAFLARMAMMASSCTTWVSTSEILSTDIRATGHGAANAMARIGGFLSPYFITQGNSLAFIGGLVLVVAAGTAECSRRLPETAGKAMGEAGGTTEEYEERECHKGSLPMVTTDESRTITGTKNVKIDKGMMRRETMEQTASQSESADPSAPTTCYQQIT